MRFKDQHEWIKELKVLELFEPCYCDAAVVRILQRGGWGWEKKFLL